jgi:DNA-binding MarR family transcriptional regulator
MVARTRAAEAEPGPEDVVRLVGVFHDVVRASFHRLRPILEAYGITLGQFLTLHIVSTLGVASVGSVARRQGVSAPAVCVSIDQLERAGLVRRQRSRRDARSVELSTTPRGHRVEARVWSEARRQMTDIVRGLPEADLATAMNVLEQIARRLEPEYDAHPLERP